MVREQLRQVPSRCKLAREMKSWPQERAAKELGWHVNTLRKYERRTCTGIEAYVLIAAAYDVSLDWLLLGRERHYNMDPERMPASIKKAMSYLMLVVSGELYRKG